MDINFIACDKVVMASCMPSLIIAVEVSSKFAIRVAKSLLENKIC